MTMLTLSGPFSVLCGAQFWVHDAMTLTDDDATSITVDALTETDRRRYLRYRTADKQRQFLVSRAVLNAVLYGLPEWSDNWRIARTLHGRLLVVNDRGEESLSVSLSHSGSITAVAVAPTGRRVGIDVEIQAALSVSTMKSAILRADETRWCQTVPDAQIEETLRQIWTIKESVWKCHAGDCHTRLRDIRVNHDGTVIITRDCDGTETVPAEECPVQAITMFSNFEVDPFPQTLRLGGLAELPTRLRGTVAMSVCRSSGGHSSRQATARNLAMTPNRFAVGRRT